MDYSKQEIAKIRSMYVNGKSDEEVSKETGRTIRALVQFRNERGWRARASRGEVQTVKRLAENGHNDETIGRRIGRTEETVRFWRDKFGIVRKDNEEDYSLGYGQMQKPRTSYHDDTPCCPLCRKPIGRKERLCWTCDVVSTHYKAMQGARS